MELNRELTGHVNIPEEVPVFASFFDGNIEQRYFERDRQISLDKNPKMKGEIENRQLKNMNK